MIFRHYQKIKENNGKFENAMKSFRNKFLTLVKKSTIFHKIHQFCLLFFIYTSKITNLNYLEKSELFKRHNMHNSKIENCVFFYIFVVM